MSLLKRIERAGYDIRGLRSGEKSLRSKPHSVDWLAKFNNRGSTASPPTQKATETGMTSAPTLKRVNDVEIKPQAFDVPNCSRHLKLRLLKLDFCYHQPSNYS